MYCHTIFKMFIINLGTRSWILCGKTDLLLVPAINFKTIVTARTSPCKTEISSPQGLKLELLEVVPKVKQGMSDN